MDPPKLIAIVDRGYLDNDAQWSRVAHQLLEATTENTWLHVQLRSKIAIPEAYVQSLYRSYALTTSCHWNMAQALPGPVAHRHLPSDRPSPLRGLFSRSVHSLNDCTDPLHSQAQWFQMAPVFTPTHKLGQALGLATLTETCQKSPRPIIAVGGIDLSNAYAVHRTGAAGIGSIGTLLSAPKPLTMAKALYAHFMGVA